MGAQPTGELELQKIPGKKQLCDSLTCHPLFYIKKITSLKTVLSVLRGVYVEKSTQGEKDFGSSLTNTIKKHSLWAIFNIHSHLLPTCDLHDTFVLVFSYLYCLNLKCKYGPS